MIHSLIDKTKVIDTIDLEERRYEVCAEAAANHDRGGNLLTVSLRAFLRSAEQDHLGETLAPDWLPAPQVVTEHVEFDEVHEMTNEIFSIWCRKVGAAMPR